MTKIKPSGLNWLWVTVGLLVVAMLIFGSLGGGSPSPDERARNLEKEIKCPTCPGQSVAQSEAASAKGVKTIIRDQIAAGHSDEEIRDYVAAKYNRRILLDPQGSGFSGLVWALPIVMVIVAVGGLIYRFRDWRPGEMAPTDDDRALVEAALAPDSNAGAEREEPVSAGGSDSTSAPASDGEAAG